MIRAKNGDGLAHKVVDSDVWGKRKRYGSGTPLPSLRTVQYSNATFLHDRLEMFSMQVDTIAQCMAVRLRRVNFHMPRFFCRTTAHRALSGS